MHRPGSEDWKKLIAEFETSGLQQKEFAAKRIKDLESKLKRERGVVALLEARSHRTNIAH